LFLFAIGTDCQTYSNFTEDGRNWAGWRQVPGQPINDLPVAAVTSGGRVYLFTAWPWIDLARILPNPSWRPYRVLVNVSDDGENWSGAREVFGDGRANFALAAADLNGRPAVFDIGTNWGTYINTRQFA
jgi:hypothetical protein